MSKEYLESLAPQSENDKALALEIGVAYSFLARSQGVPGVQNLGQYAQAEESLIRAKALIEPVLKASPRNRQAILTLAEVSEGLMTLARQTNNRNEEAVTYARQAVRYLDTLLALGPLSQPETRDVVKLLYSVASGYRNLHLHEEAMRYALRSTEVARTLPAGDGMLAEDLSLVADLKRISGDLEESLRAVREARSILEKTDYTHDKQLRSSWYLVLWREGLILGGGNGLNLNQPEEAAATLQRAFDVIEDGAQSDPNDASIRVLFDQTARELGAILREREPERALRIYDQALQRLGEIKNNPRARRGEAGLLAGSSYALRRLHRTGEARSRIDAAFQLLSETNDYPSTSIDTDSEVEPALRALADHYAAMGECFRAAEVYQELLDKILASKPDLVNDLRRATKISRIYEALSVLRRVNHQYDSAEAVSALRLKLWRQWLAKSPNSTYVKRQLVAAGGSD
jgi:tetratricopeptide (TPR) repeat protein